MRNTIALLALAVLLAGVVVVLYWHRPPAGQGPVSGGGQGAPRGTPPQERRAVHPPVRYPVANDGRHPEGAGGQAAQPLPPLGKSDGPFREALEGLFGAGAVKDLFDAANIIQRVVVTLDNVTEPQLPLRYLPVKPVPGRFRVSEKRGRIYLSPRNYQRYAPYVRLAESVDAEALVAIYVRFYPLFQQAYESLGYKGYFNDRLVAVIKTLLDTPEVGGPVKLIQPSVYYKYADPGLEALTAGQKILVRMGPDNARHIKAKLRALRERLMRLGRRKSE